MGISQKTNPNILLTEVCNMNCAYCFAKETMMAPPKKEMSLADFERLLVFLKNNRQNEVRLMGGEPTLHSQFKEIVDLALSHSLKVKIFTNGFFSEDLAHWLANSGNVKYEFQKFSPVS